MRISVKTRRRNLLIMTGSDAEDLEAGGDQLIQLSSGDLSLAPDPDGEVYEEDDGTFPSDSKKVRFGFAPRAKPNVAL